MTVSSWYSPPKTLTLESNEVHVWRATLDLPTLHVQVYRRTLTADEQARADRFHFQRDREQFIVARGILRTILGRYLEREPSQLRFCYNPHGKPALTRESGGDMLRFNLSHSHGLVLYTVTRGREVGIDLEQICSDRALSGIAERFFSPQEVAVLRMLPARVQIRAFFACWTRKEAYIKAKGEGLSIPLNQFDVSLVPGAPAKLLSTRNDPQDVCRWSLQELIPELDYVAALVVEGHDWQLRCWQWPQEVDKAKR